MKARQRTQQQTVEKAVENLVDLHAAEMVQNDYTLPIVGYSELVRNR